MTILHKTFLGEAFLRAVWGHEYNDFKDSEAEAALVDRLGKWRDREVLKETAAEEAFINQFFRDYRISRPSAWVVQA